MQATMHPFSYQATRQPIVFYDGDCLFCNYWVRFIIKHNTAQNLYFATLQSAAGLGIQADAVIKGKTGSTILLLQDNRIYESSEAVLKIASQLSFPWKAMVVFRIIPVTIRDFIYRQVARNRYRFSGRKSSCNLDIPGIQHRFL
jgi:predicted DCC family thiol-disulfide oxidoreductase YuxK